MEIDGEIPGRYAILNDRNIGWNVQKSLWVISIRSADGDIQASLSLLSGQRLQDSRGASITRGEGRDDVENFHLFYPCA